MSKTHVLALYDPNRETMVSADASSYGLGDVLRQRTNGTLRPMAHASRAMTPTEQRFSQIEKEALTTTWSLGRFTDYLYGMSIHVESDHKEELRQTIATHSMFSNAFDAIHVRDRSGTRKSEVERRNPSDPMTASGIALRPWQKVGTDMFVYNKATYLQVVDYASSYVEIAKLAAMTSPDVILHLRSIFARHGIPESVVSDNGPQYASYEFARFASEECFIHVTSGQRYPKSNGKAKRHVQTVKAMLNKSVDPYCVLLAYRTTSLECGYSPAQLLMGRHLRTSIRVMASTLQHRWDESKQCEIAKKTSRLGRRLITIDTIERRR